MTRRPSKIILRTLASLRRHAARAATMLPAGVLLTGAVRRASGQEPATVAIGVSTSVPADRFVDRRAAIELALDRPLGPAEGELVVMIGGVDVSDLLERTSTTLVYRPGAVPLPPGEQEIVVYHRAPGRWTELRRFPLKVLRRGGLIRASIAPSATLGNTGQLAEGRSEAVPEPDRRTFQDFTATLGMRTAHEAVAWGVEVQGNAVGASRREQTLRFGLRGRDAPRLDLSDYLVTLRGRNSKLAVGHVSVGSNRHLVNGFGSRGATLTSAFGPASLTVGIVNGSAAVGWDNLIGLGDPRHRVATATIASELVPRRPGALRVDVSLLGGSLRPRSAFTQGAVVDAERSGGAGAQLSASTPGQRVRLSAGVARSRFTNPARDRELLGDTVVRRVTPETRGARYVEMGVGVLQGKQVPTLGAVRLDAGYRHERVDPLYRSVAAPVQADRQQHALDLNLGIGLLAGQMSHSRGHDNLDRVPSVLRTLQQQSTASFTLPLSGAARLRRAAAFVPTLTYTLSRTHQRADGTPTNGDFRPTDLPDQVSAAHDAAAQWQRGRWRLIYRYSASLQDNRQPLREQADFATGVHAAALGVSVGTTADLSGDASHERQHARERDETSRVRRLGVTWNWRPRPGTSLVMAVSTSRARDAARPNGARNADARVELSQAVPFRPPTDGSARGQFFLRYATTTASVTPSFGAPDLAFRRSLRQWTLSSGFSWRVFK